MRLEVFTAVRIQVEVLWVVTPCSVVVGYQRFRSVHFQNYMASQSRRSRLESTKLVFRF
jgi:hypothetical protein